MDPLIYGGHMISSVNRNMAVYKEAPGKFEAGTGRLEGVVGLGAAVDYITSLNINSVQNYERKLTEYGLNKLLNTKDVHIYGSKISKNRLPIFSFNIANVHSHDSAEILNRSQIATRAGHHCAQVLMETLKITGTIRASLSIYNTTQDIDKLIFGIEQVKKVFKI
jgi:cysteine desulfurase / selenocysteine lyase